MDSLSEKLTPDFLKSIWDFWLGHFTEEEHVLPPRPKMLRWFVQSDEFDSECAWVSPVL